VASIVAKMKLPEKSEADGSPE